ncbi:TrkA family potassium uptake protein [Candidatus Poribacteria bacterium]|nr:TrkA family potassium uptake protein [Candidatus Poribacteria bacterium]
MAALRIAVIGLGQLGRVLVQELSAAGAEVLAIDADMENVEAVKSLAAYAVRLDSTDADALRANNLAKMDAVVVTIGKDFESMVLTLQELLLMGVTCVHARASSPTHRLILERLGITDIIAPEEDAGRRLARRLVNPGLVDYIDLSDEYQIAEIQCPTKLAGSSLAKLELIRRYRVVVVTIRRLDPDGTSRIIGVPGPDTEIEAMDTLIVLGTPSDIHRLVEHNR